MAQQRIFKLFKNDGSLNFSTLLYTYRDYKTSKKISNKVESPPTIIDEDIFMSKINDLSSTSDFLHPGTIWSSIDSRSFIVAEPAGIKKVYVAPLKATFDYPHPNVVYYITKTSLDMPYVAGVWFYLTDKITSTTMFYPAWSLNIFKTGLVCTHNVEGDEFPKDIDYNILINTAIEDFWRGNFNEEVTDLAKVELHNAVEPIIDIDFKNEIHWLYKQLDALAKNYSIGSHKFLKTMNFIAGNYYKMGNLTDLINSVIANNPQTQLTSSIRSNVLANNYVISDIIASAYSSYGNT